VEAEFAASLGDLEGERAIVSLTRTLVQDDEALGLLSELHERFLTYISEEGGGGLT
jgi:hypothetical protein